MAPRRPRLLRLLLALGGALIALVGAELLARGLGLAPELGVLRLDHPWGEFVSSPDPLLGYVPAPGGPGLNTHGFRDRERALRKPDGTLRVLVLGDSVAYGFCNPRGPLLPEETFAWRLEERLSSDQRPVEVLNLGVSGYDTRQELRLLETRGLDFAPDLVLLAVTPNDAQVASTELSRLRKKEGWAEEHKLALALEGKALAWSHLYRALVLRLPDPEPEPEGFEEVFRRLARLARREGLGLRAALFPDRGPPHRDEDLLTHRIEAAGIPLLSLKPVLLAREDLYAPCSAMHPNAQGHAAAAEALTPFLEAGLAAL